MTLIIAAEGKDFVILGADSRATIESGRTRVEINFMEKIVPVSEHVAVLLAGEAEVADRLVERFKLSLRKKDDGVSNIADKLTRFCIKDALRLAGVPVHPEYFPDFGFIIAGLDKRREQYKIPRTYTLDSLTGFRLGLSRRFAIDGKRMIAYYLFAKEFEQGMNRDDVCALVAKALNDTLSIDGDVGGKIRMAQIDPRGFEPIPETEIQNDYIVPWDVEKLRLIAEKQEKK
jgi:20S proteasome alpha/beta subunit